MFGDKVMAVWFFFYFVNSNEKTDIYFETMTGVFVPVGKIESKNSNKKGIINQLKLL